MVNIIKKETPNNLIDNIKKYVWENRFDPAKKRDLDKITIRTGDIHDETYLKSRIPAICSSLKTKIDKMFNIEIINNVESPSSQGAS